MISCTISYTGHQGPAAARVPEPTVTSSSEAVAAGGGPGYRDGPSHAAAAAGPTGTQAGRTQAGSLSASGIMCLAFPVPGHCQRSLPLGRPGAGQLQ